MEGTLNISHMLIVLDAGIRGFLERDKGFQDKAVTDLIEWDRESRIKWAGESKDGVNEMLGS